MADMKSVLDVCCGSRMMWFDRGHAAAIFGDVRLAELTVPDRSHGQEEGVRRVSVSPDLLLDFRSLPFADGAFSVVVFDPPHLESAGPRSWMAAKYGRLGPDWQTDLAAGFRECLRVLKPGGTLIFKWAETQVPLADVLQLAPVAPLFGNTAGRRNGTHWLAFMRPEAS